MHSLFFGHVWCTEAVGQSLVQPEAMGTRKEEKGLKCMSNQNFLFSLLGRVGKD